MVLEIHTMVFWDMAPTKWMINLLYQESCKEIPSIFAENES
jgi:hypothetical protein